MVDLLRALAGETTDSPPPAPKPVTRKPEPAAEVVRNIPLIESNKDAARAVADLYEDLVTDPASMTPAARNHMEERPRMTSDVLAHWNMGYLPRDGRSMFRGNWLFTHRDRDGKS